MRFKGFLSPTARLRQFFNRTLFEVLAFQELTIRRGKFIETFLKDDSHLFFRCRTLFGCRFLPEGSKPLQQGSIALLFSAGVACRATGDNLQPSPESFFGLKHADITKDSQESLLQRLMGLMFLTSRDDQEELIE